MGALVGGLVVLGAVWLLNSPAAPPVEQPAVATAEPGSETVRRVNSAEASTSASLAVPVQACGFEPVVPPEGESDGRYRLKAVMSGGGAPAPTAFTSAGREAAQEGRTRDAEVAFIVACRLAAAASPAPSVPLADAELELAQHYAAAAGSAQEELRAELLARARQLMASSAEGYRAVLGDGASKTRIAQQRAAQLQSGGALTRVSALASAAPGAVMGAAPARTPRLDEDLAQLDSDLQRLAAQAGAVTDDPRGFQRRMAQAEDSRQACQDDSRCLARGYAQRRKALLGEF